MAREVLNIDVNDEQLQKLEKTFEKFREGIDKTPRDWKNLTGQFASSAKVLSGITKDISSWTANLKQATAAMRDLAKEAAGVSRSLGLGGGGSGSGRSGGGRSLHGGVAGLSGDGRAVMWSFAGREAARMTSGIPIVGSTVSGATTGAELAGAMGMGMKGGAIAGAIAGLITGVLKLHKDAAMTLLGRGDMYGINSLAGRMADERRYTMGLGSTRYGARSAFESAYGRYVDPGQVLGAGAEAMMDPTSSAFQTYMALGIDPTKGDPGEAQKRLIERIRTMAKSTDMTMLGPALYDTYGLQNVGISKSDLLRMKITPTGEAGGIERDFDRRSKEAEISDNLMRKQQEYATQVEFSSKMLDRAFVKTIGEKLTPELTRMSDQLGRLANDNGIIQQFGEKLAAITGNIINWEGRAAAWAGGAGPRPIGNEGFTGGGTGVVAGTPSGRHNASASLFNPGNIMAGSSLAQYPNLRTGIQASWNLLQNYRAAGLVTPYDILHRWAGPQYPGNTQEAFNNYVKSVSQAAGVGPNESIYRDNETAFKALAAMFKFEQGQAFDPNTMGPSSVRAIIENRVIIENRTGASVSTQANQAAR